MNGSERLDVFKSVHKGLRKALFGLAAQAGTSDAAAREDLGSLSRNAEEVFHFLEHHARNEDRFLEPEMEAKSMAEAARMREDHASLEAEVEALRGRLHALAATEGHKADLQAFYLALNHFIARYLMHLHDEETAILPALQARFADGELREFTRRSVAGTEPKDQEMMLSRMFPAMNGAEIREFFDGMRATAPAETLAHVEGIAKRVLGAGASTLFT